MTLRIEDNIESGPADNSETLGAFLKFLAADLEINPERIKAMDTKVLERLQQLADCVDVDLDPVLQDDDD